MIEAIGPNVARSIVGDAYSPDFRYELETDDEGLHLHITNKQTGETNTLKLTETTPETPKRDELYSEEREDQIKEEIDANRAIGYISLIVTITMIAICAVVAMWVSGVFG